MADDERLDPRQKPILKMFASRPGSGSTSSQVTNLDQPDPNVGNSLEEIYQRANTPESKKRMEENMKML